ncbi:MAG: class I SAM-dependent methyltransferase [Gemmatimonadales bacterium]|nr:class I SAM-dependent methyltransferase [Gemmatimonadales bacterium]
MTTHTEPGDPVGAATLEQLAAAGRYNRWMFDRLRPWLGRRVLEVGSGIGNLSAFLADRERVVLTDTRAEYLDRLRARFAGHPNIAVARLYLPNDDRVLAGEQFDTVICLNVLEHVADDASSLDAIRKLLTVGGRLILLVPALRALYGTLDEALGHYRRYTRGELAAKFAAAAFHLRHIEYFNLAGITGWRLTGRVLRRRAIPAGSLRLYDALVPLFRLERWLPWRVGQSLIAIGERRS